MMSSNYIKHYLLSDEEVANLKARFGQFIMTESGLLYIDLDENTRIQLGGSGGSSAGDSYTKEEVDALITELENELTAITSGLEWKPAVDTYEDIAATYPAPADGWTVNTKDKDETYRYTGTEWVLISANSIPIATVDLDGLLSKEDKTRIDSLSTEVLSKISESEDGNLLFNGEEIKGGGSIEVDTELSGSSENPVQNKVIYDELQNLKLNAIKNTKVVYVNHQYKSTKFTEAGTEITYRYTGTAGNLVIAAFMYRAETLNKISGFDSWTYLGTSYEKQEMVSGKETYPQNVDIFYKFVDGTEDTFTYSINLADSWTMSLFVEFKNADTPFWREDLRKEFNYQGAYITCDKKTDNCVLFGTNVMYFIATTYQWSPSISTVRQIPPSTEEIVARCVFIMDNNENALPFTIHSGASSDGCGESFYGIEIPANRTTENGGGGSSFITIDSELSETSENPVQNKIITSKLNEVFQSVSDGKSLVAAAITDKGVSTAADATFKTIAENIKSIEGTSSAVPESFNSAFLIDTSDAIVGVIDYEKEATTINEVIYGITDYSKEMTVINEAIYGIATYIEEE